MSKVYGIFYDQNRRVLVGSGGRCGWSKEKREGYHLPGGTIDGTGKMEEVNEDKMMENLWRELTEELGKTFGEELNEHLEIDRHIDSKILNGHRIYFVTCQIQTSRAMNRLIGLIKDRLPLNPYDEPFENSSAVDINIARDNFSWHGQNWFVEGLTHIRN